VLLGDLGLQQVTENVKRRMLTLQPVGHHLIEGGAHAGELERRHHLEGLMALRGPGKPVFFPPLHNFLRSLHITTRPSP
jgi:hypothetical protein